MKYVIGCCIGAERAVYYSRDGKPTGIPVAFLRDKGMESACEELVRLANVGAKKEADGL